VPRKLQTASHKEKRKRFDYLMHYGERNFRLFYVQFDVLLYENVM